MKVSGFWVIFFVLWATMILLGFSSSKTASSLHDVQGGDGSTVITISRKQLKESSSYKAKTKKGNEDDEGTIDMKDYQPIDPVPSSKASIRPGPIEHGSPITPYIPKPSPPPADHPIPKGAGGGGGGH